MKGVQAKYVLIMLEDINIHNPNKRTIAVNPEIRSSVHNLFRHNSIFIFSNELDYVLNCDYIFVFFRSMELSIPILLPLLTY